MNEKSALLKEIQAEDFAVYEAVLYLDGHPNCAEALNYYHEHNKIARELKAQYENSFGPLNIYSNRNCGEWQWVSSPWPWEKEAN